MSISYEAKVFLTVYYVTLATIGIPGNILTCVFSVEKSSRKMSATNCFLLNLSIVDLLNLSLGETFSWSFFSSQLKLENMYRIEHSYHVKHENLLLVLIYVCSCFLPTYLCYLCIDFSYFCIDFSYFSKTFPTFPHFLTPFTSYYFMYFIFNFM